MAHGARPKSASPFLKGKKASSGHGDGALAGLFVRLPDELPHALRGGMLDS